MTDTCLAPQWKPDVARRRRSIVGFVADRWRTDGIGPTVREIAREHGTATSVAQKDVQTLIRAGLLERVPPGVGRALRVSGAAPK